ncbi:Nuclease SbcCD subunit C [bacterium HR12]|nr:Nuclease SbcCD subunit C [bacterium HR12]
MGRQVGQLVSQGQPRMTVTLEFAVDAERYRVTRSTPAARGATRVLLERFVDGGWVQAGEGADRVREADAMIREAIGLDYQAFTRSVLLPQGRFAEFLVGDAAERRRILTELLGLELFERLPRRAGELRREAEARVGAMERVIEDEYAGVTPEALADAEAAAREAEERERSLAEAEARVREVGAALERAEAEARELAGLAASLEGAARLAEEAERAIEGLVRTLAEVEGRVKERARAVAAAERALARARAARARAEAAWGTPADLGRLRATAEGWVATVARRSEIEAAAARARDAVKGAEAGVATAEAAVGPAEEELEAARAALAEAEEELEAARHAELVTAVRAGLRVGEPCPVCGAPIERLPRARGVGGLRRAELRRERARARVERAQATLDRTRRERDRARAALEAAAAELARAERELRRATEELDRAGAELEVAFGRVPEDPVGAVEERLERLAELEREEEAAREALDAVRAEHRAAERERDALQAELAAARGSLGSLQVEELLARARERVAGVPAAPSALDRGGTPAALVRAAGRIRDALARTAALVRERAEAARVDEGAFARRAAEALGGLVPVEVGTVAEIVRAVGAARAEATRRAAEAAAAAASLRERLGRLGALLDQLAEQRARRARFEALAKELRADRIIAFLQQEALEVLAAAGSERLAALSGGRYRLLFEGDEFSVVDTWNGEERRSARTLSVGETFLASLALALALSEQVASLSVTDKARLDSLFLDEGFGTLDPDTLEVVVEALEQLGGDGRMVGVITHVPELAMRMPARFVVEKSPRGSRVRLET